MSHYKHSIDLALLVKLKHEELEREADQSRLAALSRASPPLWASIARSVNRLRRLFGGIRAEQSALDRQDEW
jgi:hypothetical protein